MTANRKPDGARSICAGRAPKGVSVGCVFDRIRAFPSPKLDDCHPSTSRRAPSPRLPPPLPLIIRAGEALRWEINFYIEQYTQYFNQTEVRTGEEGGDGSDEVETQRRWFVHEVIMGEWRTLGLLKRLCNGR